MSTRKRRTGFEWVGGIGAMPAYVTGEGEPYRPEALLWMGAEGAILGSVVGKPGELLGLACESLRATIEQPMWGRPHAPDRVRVASPELAEALRVGQSAVEVVCAPTPEIDAAFAALREHIEDDAGTEASYLSPDIDPVAVAAFFRAAAALFRAQPWKTVPSDQSIFSVSIEKLGVSNAALCVIGQLGQSLGVILFASIEDYEVFVEAAEAMEHGAEPTFPPHFALSFDRGAELSAARRKQIAAHHWEVAGADAYPRLIAIDAEMVARPPTAKEVTLAEAIALALTAVLRESTALRAAWDGGEPVARRLVVATHAGEIEVSLRVPYERGPGEYAPPYDVLADLLDLGRDREEIDPEARGPLEDELVRRFVASPEAKALNDAHSCRLVMEFAANHFDATIATLLPNELREIVFDIIPRKVSIDASAARGIIEENRAFYAFLKREFGLPQADACLRVLGGDAVERLAAGLSDPSKFGMAKSLFMGGREAGFDMDSKEGIEAWMRVMQSQPLPASIRLPSLDAPARPHKKTTARAKKNARKAARKARKKNR